MSCRPKPVIEVVADDESGWLDARAQKKARKAARVRRQAVRPKGVEGDSGADPGNASYVEGSSDVEASSQRAPSARPIADMGQSDGQLGHIDLRLVANHWH